MPQTQFGNELDALSIKASAQLKSDLQKLSAVPLDMLRGIIIQLAKKYPCISVYETCAFEIQQSGMAQDLGHISDAVAAVIYIWENSEGDPIPKVVTDLLERKFISSKDAPILTDLMNAAEEFRESGKVVSKYMRLGTPLFVNVRGTVDIRALFHKTQAAFLRNDHPSELVDLQQIILTDLDLQDGGDQQTTVSFLMDETDLRILKRFVENMERELELTKGLLRKQS